MSSLIDPVSPEDLDRVVTYEELEENHLEEEAERFPLLAFTFFLLLQLGAVIGLFALVAPSAFRAELANPGGLVLWTFVLGIPLSLFEYLYHRYLLHSAVLPFLGTMHKCHSEHHGLTYVKAPVTMKDPELLVPVKSEYPIEHAGQEASMMFPYFSSSVFYLIFLAFMGIPLKLAFPDQPFILSTIFTVTLCYAGYELWHAMLHLSYERFWKPLMGPSLFGRWIKHIYSFHLMHHWRPTSNLAVVGFWGFAIWDHLFRTHRRPINLPVHGAKVNYNDAKMKKPVWPISLIDKHAGNMYKASRRLETSFFRLFKKS